MALQVLHTTSQGGEEIFECSGDEEDQRILSEEKASDRLSNYRELVRAKSDPQSDQNGSISTQTLSPSEAFEVFQGVSTVTITIVRAGISYISVYALRR